MPHNGLCSDVHPAEEMLALSVDDPQDPPFRLAPVDDVVGAQRDLLLQKALKAIHKVLLHINVSL